MGNKPPNNLYIRLENSSDHLNMNYFMPSSYYTPEAGANAEEFYPASPSDV